MKTASLLPLLITIAMLSSSCAGPSQAKSETAAQAPIVDQRLERFTRDYDALLMAVRTLKPEAFEEVGLYRIEPGDTGAKIAAKHGIMLSDLLALNPDVDWRRLKVWQIIRVRAAGEQGVPNPEPTSPTVTPPAASSAKPTEPEGAGDRANGARASS